MVTSTSFHSDSIWFRSIPANHESVKSIRFNLFITLAAPKVKSYKFAVQPIISSVNTH